MRQYGFGEPHDPGEPFFSGADPLQKVFADFVFNGPVAVPRSAQRAQGVRKVDVIRHTFESIRDIAVAGDAGMRIPGPCSEPGGVMPDSRESGVKGMFRMRGKPAARENGDARERPLTVDGEEATVARFSDALATGVDLVSAAERATRQALGRLDGPADLVCVFVSGVDPEEVALAGERAMALAEGATTIGCSADGVIGGGRGTEGQGAVSVWAAMLPGVTMTPFELAAVADGDQLAVIGMLEPEPVDQAALLLANPYVFPTHTFVEYSNTILGDLPIVGGLADGSYGGDSVRLFLQGQTVEAGAVGLLIGGNGVLGTVVSQGCRPIGPVHGCHQGRGEHPHGAGRHPRLRKTRVHCEWALP